MTFLDPARDEPGARADRALKSFGLDALLSGAARLRAQRLGLSWSGEGVEPGSMTFGAWDEAATRCADALADCGLVPGEAAFIVGAADPASLTLLFGAIRAGLDVALCPAGLDAAELAGRADMIGAAALLAPGYVGGVDLSAVLPEAGALAPSVRLATCLGETSRGNDGVLRLDLDSAPPRPARGLTSGEVIAFDAAGRPVRWRQDRLAAAALDFMHRARIGPTNPIVSTLAPMRMAGLTLGPLASLASGAALHLHGPFALDALVASMRQGAPARLALPADLVRPITDALNAQGVRLASVLALREAPRQTAPVAEIEAPIVDLWRWGEAALAAEPRHGLLADEAPCGAHHFPLDDDEALAFEARVERGDWEVRGAACVGGPIWTRI